MNSTNQTDKITINEKGEQTSYDKRGSGPHKLLCIPGALGTAHSDFTPQLQYFGRKDSPYTIVGYDPLGYGSSRPPERNFEMKPELFFERDACDGHSLMQSLSFPKFSVLGWSDGGIAAMFLAARFPMAVQNLVIWGSNAYITEQDLQLFKKTRDVKNWSARMREPLEAIYGTSYFPKLWSDWIDGMSAIYDNREEGDLCMQELPDIKCPTLIVHGAKDAMCPQFHAEYIHKHITGSNLVVMADGKHNLHLRYAQQFNELVDKFLSGKND